MNRPFVLLAVSALALTGPTGAAETPPAEAAARQAIAQQYRALDAANTSKDAKTLLAVLRMVCAPGFVATDPLGKAIPRAKWRAKVQDDATLGGRVRPNSGNFRVVEGQQVNYETVIDKLTLAGKTVTAEVRRLRRVGTTGRTAPGGPRQMTGEVYTETDRDRWTRTPQGWRLQSTQTLKMSAISSIGFLDPPAPKARE